MKSFRLPARSFTQPPWLLQARRTAAGHWARLAPRERRLVSLAAAVAGLTLVWLLLLEPALQATQRLRQSLPALRAQAAQVDAVVREARTLQRQGGGAATPQALQSDLEASLAMAGLTDVASIAALEPGQWQVTVQQAPAQALIQWLQSLPFELRIQASHVTLHRPTRDNGAVLSGMLSGTVTLADPNRRQP